MSCFYKFSNDHQIIVVLYFHNKLNKFSQNIKIFLNLLIVLPNLTNKITKALRCLFKAILKQLH